MLKCVCDVCKEEIEGEIPIKTLTLEIFSSNISHNLQHSKTFHCHKNCTKEFLEKISEILCKV